MFEDALNAVNAVRDKTGGGRKTTGKGTFRNVPFLVIEEQKQAGGRRLVKREYPLRDTGGVNDLGKKLRSRTFSACILNSNAETARDEAGALMDALDAPGSGELVHPDFGTVAVMVDSWECRTKADELNYYAFTVTVYPSLQDTAPDAETDTSAAVSAQAVAVTGSLGDTLSSVWQTVKDGTAAATAVMDAVTGVIDDICDAVDNLGITQTVSGLMGSLSAMKGSVTDDSLTTDVTISLFTDRRALDSDTLPDGSDDRRGWWGDSYRDRPIGSRLWLLSREKATPDTLERARGYAEEALEWLKTAGRVSAINVRAEQLHQGWLYLYIALTLPDGSVIPYEFKAAFNGV